MWNAWNLHLNIKIEVPRKLINSWDVFGGRACVGMILELENEQQFLAYFNIATAFLAPH